MNILNKLAFSSALLMTTVTVQAALDSSEGTDYANTVSDSWVDSGPAADSLQMVNFLLCVMDKSNISTHVNETYSSMIDENDCNGESADSPAFATQVMTTSRADNLSPYTSKNWFVTAEGMQVVAEVSITSSATTALPRGVLTLTWHVVAPVGNIGTKGSLSTNADGTLSYIENQKSDQGSMFSYIHGTLAADGTSGNLRVQSQDYSGGMPVAKVYTYVFDANNVHYDTATPSADVCLDRTEANMTIRTHGYKLFTAAGAEKVISGPFDFSYTDASSVVQRGWASPNGAWLQGNESGLNKPTTITRNSNSKVYSICYDDDWSNPGTRDNGVDDTSGLGCGEPNDDISIHLVHATEGAYTFDPALEFDSLTFKDLSSGASVTSTTARYDGAGSSLDLGWQCKAPGVGWIASDSSPGGCENATNWRPAYAVASGTELTEKNTGTKYYIKALNSMTTLATSASCSAIPLAGAPADAGYTSGSIPAVTITWADIPTVPEANVMKVIHGVEQ
jgi:hypothetical protein